MYDDPDGRCPFCPWLDAVVDVGFVLFDAGLLIYEGVTTGSTSSENWAALLSDVGSIFVPMSVGAGMATRGAMKAAKATKAADHAKDAHTVVDKVNDGEKILNVNEITVRAKFNLDHVKKLRGKKNVSGVYKIHFLDGTYCIGQSEHIGKRMSQNTGKYGKFDPKDILSIEYKKVDGKKPEREIEEQKWIDEFEGGASNKNLRNKVNPISEKRKKILNKK